jgi:hypothetical protein
VKKTLKKENNLFPNSNKENALFGYRAGRFWFVSTREDAIFCVSTGSSTANLSP